MSLLGTTIQGVSTLFLANIQITRLEQKKVREFNRISYSNEI